MKLTGELKSKVESTDNPEVKRSLIESCGMPLTDEELHTVAGGSRTSAGSDVTTLDCPNGGEHEWLHVTEDIYYCPKCKTYQIL